MANEEHSAASSTQGLQFLEVKYVFIVQSLQEQPMTIEAESLSRAVLNWSFLDSHCRLLAAFLLISWKIC
jgi:hypothetical protein